MIDECGAVGGMRIGKGNRKYSEKTSPNSTSSTTNPTWPDLGPIPARRSGKPATDRLSYGMAFIATLQHLHYDGGW
jgi:hypothetical protein